MIRMKTKGPWKQLISILGSYDKRLAYVRQRASEALAEAFLERLKSISPTGNKYKEYIDSLEVVKLTGPSGLSAFAVVSMKTSMNVGSILKDDSSSKTVVYMSPVMGHESYETAELLSSINPWPVGLLPHGIPRGSVRMVHKLVTAGEMDWATRQATVFVRSNSKDLGKLGIQWGKIEDKEKSIEGMESIPDYMTLALRAEFGINSNPNPHWRPSIKWVVENAESILSKDDSISDALHDWLFRGHTYSYSTENDDMALGDFIKNNGNFQQKVLNIV